MGLQELQPLQLYCFALLLLCCGYCARLLWNLQTTVCVVTSKRRESCKLF